jgi:hypothetical protein
MDSNATTVSDTYFRRLFVPIVVTILILCGLVVLMLTPPGMEVKWDVFNTAYGSLLATPARMAGGLRK